MRISTCKLVDATGAAILARGTADVSGEVTIDSRTVGEDSVFVAFAGERVDGNAYVRSAIEAGAALVVASAEVSEADLEAARGRGCWVVRAEGDDCEEWMLRAAALWRRMHPEWVVVGVTGSVGKTTTKDMLRCGISSQRRTHATVGNFNNLIGLPLTVLSAPEDSEVLVCELGMNHPHEIDRLAAACEPTLAVITNVGTSHIGLLGSRENIARAKAEVVGGLVDHGELRRTLTLTSANDFTPFIADGFARPAGVDVLMAGSRAEDDVRSADVTLSAEGCATLTASCSDGWSREVTLSVPGRQVVPDFLLALSVIWRLGLDRDLACEAIERMPATHMRLDVQMAPSGARVIDDSYNAAPNSMAASLDVLAQMACSGRRIAVLGEMGELGADEGRLHGYVGAYAAAKGLDLLVFIGHELAGQMAEAARTVGQSEDALEVFPDVASAAATLGPILSEGDLVLVKASRAAGLDGFVKEVLAQ